MRQEENHYYQGYAPIKKNSHGQQKSYQFRYNGTVSAIGLPGTRAKTMEIFIQARLQMSRADKEAKTDSTSKENAFG
ncbi:hypothetical protein QE152_g5403 [Popillia japonica]|uniref:Uncharacterized protein n=1 Tax=Popillia japonica TaxID=7064 RepID=A0AAW1MIZ3_POPJA